MSGVPGTYKNYGKTTTSGILLPATDPLKTEAGTVGVIAGERGSYTAFMVHLMATLSNAPQGSGCIVAMGVDPAGNSNQLCRRTTGDWLWIMGDDHSFGPDLLPRLLSHNVDVVVPHCLKRNPPWAPVVYSHQDEDGWYVSADLPAEGLTQIHAAGSAGMLIRRYVLDAIDDPWFTPTKGSVGLNEDLGFCEKVREAGFKIYCDPGAVLGHISHYTVWPHYRDGQWQIVHEFDQETHIPITRLPAEPVPA